MQHNLCFAIRDDRLRYKFLYAQMDTSKGLVDATVSTASVAISESLNIQNWTSFEFITNKRGAKGPSKSDCLRYYSQLRLFASNTYL